MDRFLTLSTAGYAAVVRLGNRLQWIGPTVARVAVGWVFFLSGWSKLHDLASVTAFFTDLGIPAPGLNAAVASTSEFVCGGLLLAGLGARAAVVPLIVTMAVAIRTALWERVDAAISLFGLAEFLYIALLVWLGTTGPGPLSVDALLARVFARTWTRTSTPAAAPAASCARRAAPVSLAGDGAAVR
jgi:putative oxidoreductase